MRLIFTAASLLVMSCTAPAATRNPVFTTPEKLSSQLVIFCGYMIDSANIIESADREDRRHRGGVSIMDKGPLDLRFRGKLCVEGELSYMGCETGPDICTGAAFDYGVEIRRVLKQEVQD